MQISEKKLAAVAVLLGADIYSHFLEAENPDVRYRTRDRICTRVPRILAERGSSA
jgi:hypothetical protein